MASKKWEDYLSSENNVVAAYQQNKPMPEGAEPVGAFAQDNAQAASPGALSGEAAGAMPAAEPALPAEDPAAEMPAAFGDEGKGVGEARDPDAPKNDFFSMYRGSSEEDKDHLAESMTEQFAPFGLSLDGAVDKMWKQDPILAAQIGEKFGFVPPADMAGKPGFKTQERALADYESDKKKAAAEQERLKKEKRQAMGGFLFEMGLRILASNRQDAGGAIAEGALGTIDARKQRQTEAEDRDMAKEDRVLKQGYDKTAEERADAENKRREKEEARKQEEHEAKKEVGALATDPSKNYAQDNAWAFWNQTYGDPESSKYVEDEGQRREDFLNWYKGNSRLTKSEVERMVQTELKAIDESYAKQPVGWDEMTRTEQRQYVMEYMGINGDGTRTPKEGEADAEAGITNFSDLPD